MKSSQVVTAAGCQCLSRNSPGFEPNILRQSGIWGAADETVLNNVGTLPNKKRKNPKSNFIHKWKWAFLAKKSAFWSFKSFTTSENLLERREDLNISTKKIRVKRYLFLICILLLKNDQCKEMVYVFFVQIQHKMNPKKWGTLIVVKLEQ